MTKVSDEVTIKGFDTVAQVDISVRDGDDERAIATLQAIRDAVEGVEDELDLEEWPEDD